MSRRRSARRSARTAGDSVSQTRGTLSAAPGPADEASVRTSNQHERASDTTAGQEQIVGIGVGSIQAGGTECNGDRRGKDRRVASGGIAGGASGTARPCIPGIQVDLVDQGLTALDTLPRSSRSTGDNNAYAEWLPADTLTPINPRLGANPLGPRLEAQRKDLHSRSPQTGTSSSDQHQDGAHPGAILLALQTIASQRPGGGSGPPSMAYPLVGHSGRPSTATSDAAYHSGSFSAGYPDAAPHGPPTGAYPSYPSASTSMDHAHGGDRPGSSSLNNHGSGQSADGSASANKSPSALAAGGGKIFKCMGFVNCDMTFTRSEHLARHVR